ncbi:MAG TPA: hypothetical protein VF030_08970 [Solirubrobacterales bacterium]
MKYVKTLGIMVASVAALLAFAATASATAITSGGSVYTGTVQASSEGHVALHGPLGIKAECNSSFAGSIASHGAATTTTQTLSTVSFPGCTNGYEIHVTTLGHFGWHWWFGGNARLTSTSLVIDLTTPLGFNCVYSTNNTEIGTVTGSSTTGGKATVDVSGAIPRTGGSAFCGSSGTLTGSYVINTPSNLNVHA